MKVDAEYHIVWDNGTYESVVDCQYNTTTGEMSDVAPIRDVFFLNLGNMTEQFVVQKDTGEKHIIGQDAWYWVV